MHGRGALEDGKRHVITLIRYQLLNAVFLAVALRNKDRSFDEGEAATVNANLEAARVLRLRRDQWLLRQDAYQSYQRQVGSQLMNLVKARASLEAIRRLDGPKLSTLQSLRSRLSGGAERLERLRVPDELRATHDLLVGAWRFAENAARQRVDAVSSGNLGRAWEASSAAAGALMMLTRAQQNIRELLELPRLP